MFTDFNPVPSPVLLEQATLLGSHDAADLAEPMEAAVVGLNNGQICALKAERDGPWSRLVQGDASGYAYLFNDQAPVHFDTLRKWRVIDARKGQVESVLHPRARLLTQHLLRLREAANVEENATGRGTTAILLRPRSIITIDRDTGLTGRVFVSPVLTGHDAFAEMDSIREDFGGLFTFKGTDDANR